MRSRWSKVLLAVVAVIIGIMVISGSALASEKPVVIHVGYENHPGEPFDPVSYTHLGDILVRLKSIAPN